ncbi:MAG: hypothetical protein NVV74_03610 [Magnetospirillum sp.]|nr:hypothetical protein [Magnetospirillum sp.]
MTSTAYTPRLEQIDELTRGLELPFAALDEEHLRLIGEALARAWSDLSDTQEAVLATGSEAEINALMETRLCQLLDEDPLWQQLVRTVTRGKETVSFNGSRLEMRPDLSIHLSTRTPSFPLIVECKLIDPASGKTNTLYCNNGLKRFLSGDYGWGVRESFMLAYVRDQSTTASCLSPFLQGSRTLEPEPYAIVDLPPSASHPTLDLARTAHNRAFKYPNRHPPKDEPGPIAIWHLWLQVALPAPLPRVQNLSRPARRRRRGRGCDLPPVSG